MLDTRCGESYPSAVGKFHSPSFEKGFFNLFIESLKMLSFCLLFLIWSWGQKYLQKLWHLLEFIPSKSHPNLIRRLERIDDKMDRNEESVIFNQPFKRENSAHTHTHTHTYIYVCVCVCVCAENVKKVMKKDPAASIRKHANDLKVHEKTVRTTIKQDLSQDINPLDYAICCVLENKTNVSSKSNIGSFNTVIEVEWNKMSEEFTLKVCKSFRKRVDTIIEKKKILAILSKSTVLCLFSYFVVYFLKLKLILFYKKAICYTGIFLILLARPVTYIYICT